MITAQEIQTRLNTFHGSQSYFECVNPNFLMSEGVNYLVEAAECNWLIESLTLNNIGAFGKRPAFLDLKKADNQWTLSITDADGKVRVTEPVSCCTFPLPEIKLIIEWSELPRNAWVIYLPSEH
jgi:hypothetical protein